MPRETSFDMSKCNDCPLKDVFARFILHNQMANTENSMIEPVDSRHFKPSAKLAMGDYEKYNVLAQQADDCFYVVDDRQCEGPEDVLDFTILPKQQCGAQIISR